MKDNITQLHSSENMVDRGSFPSFQYNSDGGGNMKDNKYVTHEELNHAVDNLNSKIDLSTEKILHHIDSKSNETEQHISDLELNTDKHFSDLELKTDKRFNKLELEINNVNNTAKNNKEKINWLLYTAVGGILISVITTIISNLLTK